MQIQLDDIRGSEPLLWQIREEEFVDYAFTCHANRTLLSALGMGCHHHAIQHPRRSNWYLRAVVETAHESTFRPLLKLVCWEMQTCLHKRMIKDRILLATSHK